MGTAYPSLRVLCFPVCILHHHADVVAHVKVVVNGSLCLHNKLNSLTGFAYMCASVEFATCMQPGARSSSLILSYLVVSYCSKHVGTLFIHEVEAEGQNRRAVAFLRRSYVRSEHN